jgi:radical SAM-linked protein
VGLESTCEYLDLELEGSPEVATVAERLAPQLPEGFKLFEAVSVSPRAPSLSESLRAVHYRADFPGDWDAAALADKIRAFDSAEQVRVWRAAPPKVHQKKRHHKIATDRGREINLKEIVTHLALEGAGVVAFSLKADPSGSAKPAEVLAAIFGNGKPPAGVKVLKEGVSFARPEEGRWYAGQPRAPRYVDA